MIEDWGFDVEVFLIDFFSFVVICFDSYIFGDNVFVEVIFVIMIVVIEGMICGVCIFVVEGGFKDVLGMKYFIIFLMFEWVVIEYDLSLFMFV